MEVIIFFFHFCYFGVSFCFGIDGTRFPYAVRFSFVIFFQISAASVLKDSLSLVSLRPSENKTR